MSMHTRFNVLRSISASAAATGMWMTSVMAGVMASVMASASNNNVKPEPGLAHATSTWRTPHVLYVLHVIAWSSRSEEGLVLEKIEMPPSLGRGVMHRAGGRLAHGAGKAAACLEVEFDDEPLLLGIKVGGGNKPWAIDTDSELE